MASETLFRGKARCASSVPMKPWRYDWFMEASPMDRATIIGFQCEQHTPVVSIRDNMLDDVPDMARYIAGRCVEIYNRHHTVLPTFDVQPMLTCSHCRSGVDLPSEQQQYDYEFCEAQAVKWMERAAKAKR